MRLSLGLDVRGKLREPYVTLASEDVARLFVMARAFLGVLSVMQQREEWRVEATDMAALRHTLKYVRKILEDELGLTVEEG